MLSGLAATVSTERGQGEIPMQPWASTCVFCVFVWPRPVTHPRSGVLRHRMP